MSSQGNAKCNKVRNISSSTLSIGKWTPALNGSMDGCHRTKNQESGTSNAKHFTEKWS